MSTLKKTKCKMCGATIVWVKTVNNRDMPCDDNEIEYQENKKGASLLVTADGRVVRGDIVQNAPNTKLVRTIDGKGYISHFATCKKNRRAADND